MGRNYFKVNFRKYELLKWLKYKNIINDFNLCQLTFKNLNILWVNLFINILEMVMGRKFIIAFSF
jgi:hypothetical protein